MKYTIIAKSGSTETKIIKSDRTEISFDYAFSIILLYQGETLADCAYEGEFGSHEAKAIEVYTVPSRMKFDLDDRQ